MRSYRVSYKNSVILGKVFESPFDVWDWVDCKLEEEIEDPIEREEERENYSVEYPR